MQHVVERARRYFRLDAHDDPKPDPTPDPKPDPKPEPTPDPKPDPKPEDRTFSQAELDRILQDRLARDRQKYADYDDIKTKAAKFDKLEAEQMSDLQKEQAARQKAEEERTKALDTANARLIRAEVKSVATDLKIVDPDAAYLLMDRSEVKVDDDGNAHPSKRPSRSSSRRSPT